MTGQPPRTVPEMLDAARDGAEFGAVINNLFKTLEVLKDKEHHDD